MTARTELEALVAKWRDSANYVGDQNMLACADELESALSALTAPLGEADMGKAGLIQSTETASGEASGLHYTKKNFPFDPDAPPKG